MPVAACIGVPSPWAPSTSLNGFIASGTSARCDWPSAPLYTRHILGMLAVLSADREPAGPRRVDDQVVDQALGQHGAQPERAVFCLAGRDRDVDLGLEPLQRAPLVVPGHRVLEPEDVVRRAERRRAHRGRQVPTLVGAGPIADALAHALRATA